jgi:hypothetical protein
MSKTSKLKKPAPVRVQPVVSGRGYAWLCDFGLCHWAEADIAVLRARGKPSPEAKAVPVRLLLERDFRKLKSANLLFDCK